MHARHGLHPYHPSITTVICQAANRSKASILLLGCRMQEVSAEKRFQHKAGFSSLGFSPKHRYSCEVTEDAHAAARTLCAGACSMKQHCRITGLSLLALRALSSTLTSPAWFQQSWAGLRDPTQISCHHKV